MTPEFETCSDRMLMDRYLNGNDSAATEIYHRYARRVIGLVNKRCSPELGGKEDADDLVQSVFRRFFQGARTGRYEVPQGDDLWKLFLVIALNRVRSEQKFRRAAKRDARRTIDLDSLKPGSEPAAAEAGVSLQMLRMEFDAVLSELPEHYRRATELRVQGYSLSEIAEDLGTSKRTVERMLQECRERLRARIVLDD